MPIFNEHPFTSITVKINQLVKSNGNDDNDFRDNDGQREDNSLELQLSTLIDLIKVQHNSGATEAARAIRKKVKYGSSTQEQIRALNILELLLLNSGRKIGPILARDDKLLDVLKGILNGHGKTGTGLGYDVKVQKRVIAMAIGWKSEFENLDGYKNMQQLYKALPKSKTKSEASMSKSRRAREEFVNDDDDDDVFDSQDEVDPYADNHKINGNSSRASRNSDSPPPPSSSRSIKSPKVPPPRPTTSSPYSSATKKSSTNYKKEKKDKRYKKKQKRSKNGIIYADEQFGIPQINYRKEAPKINALLNDCQIACVDLKNQLLQLPPDASPLDDSKINSNFDNLKGLRRKLLKYIQFVGAGDPQTKSSEVNEMDEKFLPRLIYANEEIVECFKQFDAKTGHTTNSFATIRDDPNEEWDESDESYYSSDDDDDDDDDYGYDEEEENDEGDIRERQAKSKNAINEEDQYQDSIAARLQSVTMDEKRRAAPPPPPPTAPSALAFGIQNKESSNDRISGLDHGFEERPAINKTDTSESFGLEGNPFGDTNAVEKIL
ncbi:hypothetical protein PVL30_003347 [Lodderomyces elongisporus]|uniref:uncharacterized protein n=1 Tax=Lodderomyces elongisporus TaxID=36914 RepID=UPI00291E3869|nr:uncharacterized protein PVL30_003347 [Lodderomyces elongisporus]WLF79591.1 hypothetical protein PVL30_003347 [Lodderomyces elongisporus]